MYKKEKINPFSSCLPLLIQLPILIAVYQVFVHGLNGQSFDLLYPGVANPGTLSILAFGFLDLSKSNFMLALMAGAAQFWQTKMLMTKNKKAGSMSSAMNTQMLYMMPIMTVFIGSRFPAGLALYWFSTTFFSVLQQLWMFRKKEIVK
jgi:YidC/Oxa1 family membrane protein insertase